MKAFFRACFYFANAIKVNLTKKNVKVALSCKLRPGSIITGPVKIGRKSFFRGELGSYSYIGENCRLYARVGKFCSISSNVKVVDASHPIHFISTSPVFYSTAKQANSTFVEEDMYDDMLTLPNSVFPCEIGNDVWIGENVIIKGGVTIGDGACIAMGAVVTKDVPPYSIVAGIPAKVIKYRFDADKIKILLETKWWERDDSWIMEHKSSFLNPDQFIEEIN
ncbi:CatB-related O-acetyltransferase [Enterococcus cecorum]|uniref:Acetyltransferase n=1 Tax=Enterococcus cecorum TaxID=44008 RepID=A0A200HQ09_9ENTE|nr:CatB-related O-acetyltransferase [Enterococcus cecorum]OUZ14862.1 hypothetical protein A5869_001967 [Enterococcus cecorum]